MKTRGKFHLDRVNGKIFGVCSGLAAITGVDATIIRIGLVVATVVGGFPWTIIVYVAAALIGKDRSAPLFGGEDVHRPVRMSTATLTGEMRDVDRRLAEVETFVTTRNSSLEREIEALRS
jgi:phage shock protein C